MQTYNFKTYKIASKLSLNRIALFFKVQKILSWKGYLLLDNLYIDPILKHKTSYKQVYIFEFGCITFVNFTEEDMLVFLEQIESITGKIDYSMFYKSYESHIIEVNEQQQCKLTRVSDRTFPFDDHLIPILSIILARSVELDHLQTDVDELLDSTENYILYLQRGYLRAKAKKFSQVTSKIMYFELNSINSIRIFDRPSFDVEKRDDKRMYNILSEFYNLQIRFKNVQHKIDDLKKIMKSYSTLSYKHIERRLLILEIFLLALFPLSYLVEYLLEHFQ